MRIKAKVYAKSFTKKLENLILFLNTVHKVHKDIIYVKKNIEKF